MQRKTEFILLTIFGILCVNGQFILDRECDPELFDDNFNIEQFAGRWYEISRTQGTPERGDCSHFEFSASETAGAFNVKNVLINDNFHEEYEGTMTSDISDTPAKFILDLPNFGEEIDFWILVENFGITLAYSCQTISAENNMSRVYLWKLSRNSIEENALVITWFNTFIFNTFGVQADDVMYNVNHEDDACYTLPILEEGAPIILPGSCDEDIVPINNFDVQAFSGLWHNIGSYETSEDESTCRNSDFTYHSNDLITVQETGVIDENIITRDSLTFRALDESGKFVYTSSSNTGREIWILDTDYDSFAITYNCENVGDNQRQVYSHILSRTRLPTSEVQENIDRTIDSLIVLNNRYYQFVNQSDEGCFYYPDHVSSQPVVFRGQCDMNVKNIPNLDIQRISGLWHAIEGYPSDLEIGTCNNILIDIVGETVLNFYTTQVNHETLDVITGSAVLIDDMFVTENDINGQLYSAIVSTNYDSYALLYSCMDLNPDERAVWSWKLSRTKEMLSEDNSAINVAISNVQVLDQRYYEEKDQSREACFFYPSHIQGEPVVFPGQCDDNIAVQTNFDLERFQGIWHEIESYPKTQQPGECITKQFEVNGNSFNVRITEIIDQFEHETLGSATLSSADGSAKFQATVTIGGVNINIPYWIIGTNYDDYALAYSCVNIDEDWRSIWSWKLSRTRSLSPESITAINTLTNNINVINDDYFEPIQHTDEDCFYLPDLAPGDPVVLVGQCDPNIAVVEDFDLSRYLGLWHMISSYPDDDQEGNCNDFNSVLSEDGIINIQMSHVTPGQTLGVISGTASSVDGSPKWTITFPGGNDREFWILDTDYESYSLVYSCENINTETRRVWSWKLGRQRSLSNDDNESIDNVINTVNVLNNRFYQEIDNTDSSCFYFPEPNNEPVVFRGQCDFSIPTVTNFDAERYSGLWHEIESYPSILHRGTCNNAQYNLSLDSASSVYSTQVINESLDGINGQVITVTDDGKFEVTFPIEGTEDTVSINYWILDTNYDDYSIMYSCENIDSDHRTVWSWKLSRTKELSAAANTAINNAINTIQVLRQDYYVPHDQSPAGCFFYPVVAPGIPLIFPGQCDETIETVNNFDIERFQGTWHQISAYPVTQLPGDCINYDIITSDNSLGFTTNQILNQRLSIYSGSASTTDNGKLSVTININGNVITLPYWILATDYEDYALAYTCWNIDSDWREVWSWKLSRTRDISDEANNVINDVIDSIQVLEEQYYEGNSQTSEDCFYFPQLEAHEPVTFFGQCDENIPVVQGFDSARYDGLWHEIESYYYELQNGECPDKNFISSATGFDVFGSQVVSETLDTVNGAAVLVSTDGSAKLQLSVTDPNTNEVITIPYWILSTDYDSYALVYSCYNLNPERRRVLSWKLSRTRDLNDESRGIIDENINSVQVLNDEYFNLREQSDIACFYYPEPVPGVPVTFRGQCDESIPVVQNFDLSRYSGIWFDVQSYPQFFQGGTCPLANYTITDDDTITVVNSQVVEQELDSITGTARSAFNDGQAKLIVTFPITESEHTDVNYWVLATDYDNFALVYSCTNIGPDRRSVSSWKLSRQDSLTPESHSQINNAINSVQVLREDYYETKGHSEDDCFYYPDNEGGPVFLEGQCDSDSDVPVIDEFDATQFSGIWHEISRFPSDLQIGNCASTEVNIAGGTSTMTIIDEEILQSVTGQVSTDGTRGILRVTFPGQTEHTFYILDTDYSDFALIYGCRNINENYKQVYSWKLGRTKDGLSEESNARVDEIVYEKIDLFQGYYESTDQSLDACFHYPTFDNPPYIRLTGPCNDTIVGISNFNIDADLKSFPFSTGHGPKVCTRPQRAIFASCNWNLPILLECFQCLNISRNGSKIRRSCFFDQYQGRWIEVNRYPNELQFGECARTTFGVSNDIIQVSGTMVYDQENIVITGTATISSDGSGLLDATYDINGEQQSASIYVLGTDYTHYALLYSCFNLPNGERQVSSWTLSREQTLDQTYFDRIAPIIRDTQGLLEEYYVNSDQSDESCFYIPEVDESQPVFFRGQCDEDIRGVENFDIEQYLGWWHEIERYPVGFEPGTCITSEYENVAGQYRFIGTNVYNLNGVITTAAVTVSTDTPGKLTMTYSNGTTLDLWVLATDYTTYSLVYSCENVDSENRRVWSAKYSKTKQLTSAAQEAIQQVIETNPVLYDQFYIPVDHSDSACFHYPEQNGPTVILPVQCDTNIPLLQNFDIGAYTGDWFEIERYPHPDQTGNCGGARYVLDEESNIIRVTNWQVVDGELDAYEGNATFATDGSARITVTMPVPGLDDDTTTTELYILASEYASYSLMYTCTNLPNGLQRYVGAWKLSRTRTMPQAGVTAINNMMSSREELHQPYFAVTHQDEECPVPLSSHLIKSTILLIIISLAVHFIM